MWRGFSCMGVPSQVKTPEIRGPEWLQASLLPLSLSHAACGPYPHLTSLPFAPRQQRSVYRQWLWRWLLLRLGKGDHQPGPRAAGRRIHRQLPAATPKLLLPGHQWYWPCSAALEPPTRGEGAGRVAKARLGEKSQGGKSQALCEASSWAHVGREGKGVTASRGKGLPGELSPQGSKLRQGGSQRVLKAPDEAGNSRGISVSQVTPGRQWPSNWDWVREGTHPAPAPAPENGARPPPPPGHPVPSVPLRRVPQEPCRGQCLSHTGST